jgi:hypothetical protein
MNVTLKPARKSLLNEFNILPKQLQLIVTPAYLPVF